MTTHKSTWTRYTTNGKFKYRIKQRPDGLLELTLWSFGYGYDYQGNPIDEPSEFETHIPPWWDQYRANQTSSIADNLAELKAAGDYYLKQTGVPLHKYIITSPKLRFPLTVARPAYIKCLGSGEPSVQTLHLPVIYRRSKKLKTWLARLALTAIAAVVMAILIIFQPGGTVILIFFLLIVFLLSDMIEDWLRFLVMMKTRILRFTHLVLGLLLLLNAIILSFVSNVHQGFYLQGLLGVGLLAYSWFYPRLHKLVHIAVALGLAGIVSFGLLLALAGIDDSLFVSGREPERVMIVLGAGLIGDQVPSHLASRLDVAAQYTLESNPWVTAIVSGGLGDVQTTTEAQAMKDYLIAQGVPAHRIIKEDQARSTEENLLFSQQIINEQLGGTQRVVLVTNRYHMFRAASLATEIGLPVTRLGAPTPWYSVGVNYLREMLAVVNWVVFGESLEPLPFVSELAVEIVVAVEEVVAEVSL